MDTIMNNTVNMKLEHLTFSALDYALFAGMLAVSALIGVYFGIFKKQNTANEYLLGGRNMGVFPIAISLAASYVSAITLLGMPAEVYTYGTQYAASCITGVISAIIIGNVFLPVFYELQVTSSFEYLEYRFCKNVRLTASFLCLFDFITAIPIVLYVPALAFNLVSGLDIKIITPIVCIVCIFYTTIGGLRAVVWTDTIQYLVMNGSIIVILMLGVPQEGGFAKIWKTAEDTDRIHFFDMNPSMLQRMSFWSMTIGMGTGYVSSMGVNQLCVQRFLSVPTLADATKVLYIYTVSIVLIKAICLFCGLIMFTRYYGCDPFSVGIISRSDQILPYYVMDTTRNIPGLPGLFIAGVFSGALSTMSSLLNTACGIIYQDFIKPCLSNENSETRGSNIMKVLVVVIGCICMVAVFWVEKLGSILQMSVSFSGITSGSMLGIFMMGMLFPRVNSKGVIAGATASVLFVSWILYGNTLAKASGAIKIPTKPFPLHKCASNLTIGLLDESTPIEETDEVFFLYRISFMWYSFLGICTAHLIGLPISYMTSPPSASQTRLEYFSPVIRRFLPKHIQDQGNKSHEDTVYKEVNVPLQDIKKNDKIDNLIN